MSFKLARAKSQSIPRVKELPLASGSSFPSGSLMLVNGSGEFAECGADPAAIAAVSLTGAGADTSIGSHFGIANFPPGKIQGEAVQDEVVWRATYVGALPAADGGSFGVIKDATLGWSVDFNEVSALRVKQVGRLTNSPENVPEVLVVFLAASCQII